MFVDEKYKQSFPVAGFPTKKLYILPTLKGGLLKALWFEIHIFRGNARSISRLPEIRLVFNTLSLQTRRLNLMH